MCAAPQETRTLISKSQDDPTCFFTTGFHRLLWLGPVDRGKAMSKSCEPLSSFILRESVTVPKNRNFPEAKQGQGGMSVPTKSRFLPPNAGGSGGATNCRSFLPAWRHKQGRQNTRSVQNHSGRGRQNLRLTPGLKKPTPNRPAAARPESHRSFQVPLLNRLER